jgi:predicted Zn-dependent peptidase
LLGGDITLTHTREITYFTIYVDRNQVSQAVELLADGILNPAFEADQIEAVKSEIHKNASSMDP